MLVEIALAVGLGGALAAWQVLRTRRPDDPPRAPSPAPYRHGEAPPSAREEGSGGYPTIPYGDDP